MMIGGRVYHGVMECQGTIIGLTKVGKDLIIKMAEPIWTPLKYDDKQVCPISKQPMGGKLIIAYAEAEANAWREVVRSRLLGRTV